MSHYFKEDKNLKSNINKIEVLVNNTKYSFFTDNGVFNKKGLDFGTRLLLENIDYKNKNSFLDVGCGCGPIGIYISKTYPNSIVDMIDVNNHAIEISKMGIKENNIKNANVFLSNVYENVKGKYDCIITNPPIHAGKKVIYEIIEKAKDHLNKNGELWVVIRKDHGAKSLINDMKDIYDVEILTKSKGFFILKFNYIDIEI